MAVFHILSSRPVDTGHSEFTVEFIHGTLDVGQHFRCYDTHHPADFRILRAQQHGKSLVLTCEGWIGFAEQFTGARLDSEQQGRPLGFHYPPTKTNA